jgi:hypothetical protein
LAEVAHPVSLAILGRALPKAIKLVQARELNLELKSRPAGRTGEWDKETGVQPFRLRCGELAPDEVERSLAVGGSNVVGEAGEVHVAAPVRA